MSQWANWYGKLEIWVRILAKAQMFSLKIIIFHRVGLEHTLYFFFNLMNLVENRIQCGRLIIRAGMNLWVP